MLLLLDIMSNYDPGCKVPQTLRGHRDELMSVLISLFCFQLK